MINAVAEGTQSLRYALEAGEALALHAGAGGKAILAFLPSVEIARILDQPELAALTRHTVTDRGELDRHLEIIRKEGYAVAREERLMGAVEIAAPVFDAPSFLQLIYGQACWFAFFGSPNESAVGSRPWFFKKSKSPTANACAPWTVITSRPTTTRLIGPGAAARSETSVILIVPL